MEKKRCFGCMNLKTESPICEHCGYNENLNNQPHQLPCGTLLKGQYLVGKSLGQGGFGITYLGWDQFLNIPVAIKEFYPNGFVVRESSHSTTVTSCEGTDSGAFQSNRDRFLREAQTLARLSDVQEVVHVRNFFETNNTAYIIMDYIQGIDLRRYINMRGGRLSAQEVLNIVRPIMKALVQVHAAGVVHRDISPDNIMMQPDGGAKLLDFGAVRNLQTGDDQDLPKSTEAILKHGFAPIEQYQRRGELGPWTDEYALCATMYYCMTGRIPADAPERMMGEADVNWHVIPGLTQEQITALETGMAIRAKDRFGSVMQLYEALYGQTTTWPEHSQIQYTNLDGEQEKPQEEITYTANVSGLGGYYQPEEDVQEQPQEPVVEYIRPEVRPQPEFEPQPQPETTSKPKFSLKNLNPMVKITAGAMAVGVLLAVLLGSNTGGGGGQRKKEEKKNSVSLTHTYSNGIQMEIKADNSGNETERIFRDEDGNQLRRYEAGYDENRNMTRLNTLDEKDESVLFEEWHYDDDGNMIQHRVYQQNRFLFYTDYEYNTNGDLVKSVRHDGDKEFETTYNRKYNMSGNQTSCKAHYDDGTYTVSEYDSSGNVIRYESYDENGKLTFASDREYDRNGNCTQYTSYNEQNVVTYIYRSTYDAKGLETREEVYNGDEILQYVYDYTYDANGNQIGYIYQSYTYDSQSTYEELRDIRGDLFRQYSMQSSGYSTISYYNEFNNIARSESYNTAGECYSTSQYSYDEMYELLGHTSTYTSSYDGTTTITEYNADYQITDEKIYDEDGNLVGWGDNAYDEYGNLTDEVDYRADGTVEYERHAEFNAAGRQTTSTTNYYDESGKLSSSYEHRYDGAGQTEWSKSSSYSDGKLTGYYIYEYEDGEIAICTYYTDTGAIDYWYKNEYDENGNNVKQTYYDASGAVDRWYENEFNDMGKKVLSYCYDSTGKLSYWTETFYDEYGNYVDSEFHYE